MSGRSAENLNRMGSVANQALDEGTSFPVKDLNAVGIDISNNDAATDLIYKITGKDKDGHFTKSYRVPAGGTYSGLFPLFTEIDVTQATTSFDMIIKEAV